MSLDEYLDCGVFCARVTREEGHSIPDWYIRRVCGDPPSGAAANAQARYSAHDVEQDRESTR